MTRTLSIIETARQELARYKARNDTSDDPQIVNFPSSALTQIFHAIAMAATRCVFQIVSFHVDSWHSDRFDSVIWRDAARRGCNIKRIYKIPYKGFAPQLQTTEIELDLASGIEVNILVVSDIPQFERTGSLEDLLVIDNSAIVIKRNGGYSECDSIWTVSEREVDLRNGINSWNKMWSLSKPFVAFAADVDLEEPLVLSADLINSISPGLCVSDHIDEEDCSWYHSVWQYLRLLDMVSTPTWHAKFYRDEIFDAIVGKKDVKILITGAADYSMLAYVDASMKSARVCGEIGIVDKCPTPLFASRWYANRLNFKISVYDEDLFNFSSVPDGSIDLICTDAFLTRFDKIDAKRILSIWHRLLKDGGRIVTTVRVHSKNSHGGRDIEVAIHDFRERGIQRANRWRSFLERSPNEIGQMAENYARKMHSENLGNKDDICNLFKDGGFILIRDGVVEVPGELFPTVYLEVVAEKQSKEN
jgi:hypothetical protein